MVNSFENDQAYVSPDWLLRILVVKQANIRLLLKITHVSESATVHFVAILEEHSYVCDCCMGSSLGVPCRHYFQALMAVKNPYPLSFHLGLIRPR